MSQNSTSSIIILPSSHQPSSSSRYLSPFSVFLQHIHLSEQLIIQLSSSLHLPLSTLFWLHKIVLVVGQKQLRNISLGHVLQWFSDCNSLVILKSTAFPDIHLPLSAHYPVSEDFSGNFFPVA